MVFGLLIGAFIFASGTLFGVALGQLKYQDKDDNGIQ